MCHTTELAGGPEGPATFPECGPELEADEDVHVASAADQTPLPPATSLCPRSLGNEMGPIPGAGCLVGETGPAISDRTGQL